MKNDATVSQLTPHDLRRVAVLASVDPRSVQRFLEGGAVRSTTAARIADALRELELGAPLPPEPPAAG